MSSIEFLERIRRLVVIALFSDDELMDRLVLKGGNLLEIVYAVSSRASLDVDFSMSDDFEDVQDAAARIERVLSRTFVEAGYVLFDFRFNERPTQIDASLRDFWGGYKIEFKLIDAERHASLRGDLERLRRNASPVGRRNSTVFKIDISKHEHCAGKQRYRIDNYLVYAYSPEMFVCEKLRAICQQMPEFRDIVPTHQPRARARDFVDIHTVSERFAVDFTAITFAERLRAMFQVKRVPLALLGNIRSAREQHRDDFQAVRDTVHADFDLREFDFYFDYVCDRCDSLKTLRNE